MSKRKQANIETMRQVMAERARLADLNRQESRDGMKLWLLEGDDGSLFMIQRAIVAAETEEEARTLVAARARDLARSYASSRVEEEVVAFWHHVGSCRQYVPSEPGIVVCDWNQP